MGLFLGDSLRYTDGKVLGSNEGTARAGLKWSLLHVVVMGWTFERVDCHATSKGADYPNFIDIIYIDHITSYITRNVHPIFHIYSFTESNWCKTSIIIQ